VNVTEKRQIGHSNIEVSRLGLGTAPLGGLFVPVSHEEATATVRAAVDNHMTLIDTAPYYGLGLSERRVGDALRDVPRDSFVLATKVGRVLHPVPRRKQRVEDSWVGGLEFDPVLDYSYQGIMRSYEDSQQRLGLPNIDMLAIHDLDIPSLGSRSELDRRLGQLDNGGGARALEELRGSGDVGAIGLGINALGSIPRVVEIIDLDYAIVAMPYTLLDQEALDDELGLCQQRGISVIIGAVFASGILAVESGSGTYAYERAPAAIAKKVARMRKVCEKYGVPLAAAALQFPLGHPAVAAVIPGAVSGNQVRENLARFGTELPAALWDELKTEGLIRHYAPVPA
jgi:D-threo-aldose 1-dehydrogenase